MIYFSVFIFLLAGNLFFWWWGDRHLRPLRKAAIWRALLAALVGGQSLMLAWWVIFPGTLRSLGNSFWKPVSAWLYMWHLLVLPTTLLALLFGYCVYWLGSLLTRLVGQGIKTAVAIDAAEPADDSALISVTGPAVIYPSRRQVLTAAAAFVPQALLAGTLYHAARQHGHFRIRNMQIALPQLPKALDGIVLAHVSDTHVGRFVGPKELDAVVAATANLHPDLIVFTGDLIDYNLADLPPALSAMKQLAQIAPLAMCVGNHDLFDDGNAFRNRVRKADVGLMVDEIMPIQIRGEKIDLLGLDWGAPGSPRADGIQQHMQNLLARRRSSAFPILLAHHPHAFDPAAAAEIPLTLSGHTHGGQIMLTHNWGCGRVYKYWSGLYEKGSSKLIVSNGVGNWFPLRIGAPAEIIRLTLRSA
jgi:predicted MPP superfamily phosphohydrolase